MEYLNLNEINMRQQSIQVALDQLLQTKAVAGKPKAKQWLFFQAIAKRLLIPDVSSPFDQLSPIQAAQFKFEIEDKLRCFYARAGGTIDYVFTLFHKSDLGKYGLDAFIDYPCLAGYCLLVRDLAGDYQKPDDSQKLLYIERVIAESIDAEFRAYMSLPEICLDELKQWFVADSPAMKEIVNILTRHRQRGWIINNTWNPSTKRLLNINVKEINGDTALVNTVEYWYLRWFDQNAQEYVHPYRATNRQTYILNKEHDQWKVFQNLRPLPRTTNVMNRNRRDKRRSQ